MFKKALQQDNNEKMLSSTGKEHVLESLISNASLSSLAVFPWASYLA